MSQPMDKPCVACADLAVTIIPNLCPLHAAAPALLKALEEVARSTTPVCARGHGVACDCSGDKVRAAICAAKGDLE